MVVFKAILKIVKKNAPNLLIGLIVTIGISLLMSGDLNQQFDSGRPAKVAVLGATDSAAAQDFQQYIQDQQELVELKDTSEKRLDDALYFGEVDYLIWLPTDFQGKLVAGSPIELPVETRPGTYTKALVDTTVNQFINTYQDLNQVAARDHYQSQALKQVLAVKGTVHHDPQYAEKNARIKTRLFYNILSYGMFMVIFNGYGAINLVFNRQQIRERNLIAPISSRSLSRKISLATLSYSLIVVLIFLAVVLTFTKSAFDQTTGLYLLNTLCLSFTIITFSIFVSSLVKNPETFSGISNVYILGSSFLGGVFVSSEIMPKVVNQIAAFTPTYWFTQTNTLISENLTYGSAFFDQFGLNCLIQLLFGMVFLLLHHLFQADRKVLRKLGIQRA